MKDEENYVSDLVCCDVCSKQWIAVYLENLDKLECPNCKILVHFEILEEDKEEDADDLVPAVPPDDYDGSIADWMTSLMEYGVWDGQLPEWYGDVMISRRLYIKILEECEE